MYFIYIYITNSILKCNKITTERHLIGSIKVSIEEEFVVIERIMVRSHFFKEGTYYLVSL